MHLSAYFKMKFSFMIHKHANYFEQVILMEIVTQPILDAHISGNDQRLEYDRQVGIQYIILSNYFAENVHNYLRTCVIEYLIDLPSSTLLF